MDFGLMWLGSPSRSSPGRLWQGQKVRLRLKVRRGNLRSGRAASEYWSLRDCAPVSASNSESLSVGYRLRAEALEPTGFEPVTSSMPLRRSTN